MVTRIFSFEKGGFLLQSEGGYSDYVFRVAAEREESQQDLSGKASKGGHQNNVSAVDESDRSSKNRNRSSREKTKLSFNEQKEYDNIESEIEGLETRCSEIEKERTFQSEKDSEKMKTAREGKRRAGSAYRG